MVVDACEKWAQEMNFPKTVLESRDNKVAFYRELGYEVCGEAAEGDTFRCIRMRKTLRDRRSFEGMQTPGCPEGTAGAAGKENGR